jgi:hypothetical protein
MLLKICHLSLLNPALHPRIFYKHALSAVEMGHEVSIVAQSEASEPFVQEGVRIIPLQPFPRLSPQRLQARKEVLQKARAVRADVYIIHTPELLAVAKKLQRQLGAKIIYDVHEDYAHTLRFSTHYPAGIRGLMASWVRRKETQAVQWLSGVFYAERIYDNILGAAPAQKLVLENTFSPRALRQSPSVALPTKPYLLYTGTIAEAWGIWESLDLWEQWNQSEAMHLVVAGHCQLPNLLARIQSRIQQSDIQDRFILIGGADYVPYADIVYLIQNCYAGLGLYHPLPYLIGKIPTKFFEFLAARKPLIFTGERHWQQFNEKNALGIPYSPIPDTLLPLLHAWYQNPPVHPPENYQWEKREEPKLKAFLESL